MIDRARWAAAEFARTLPDFVCDQITVRHEGDSRGSGWKQKDRVEAEVVYAGGQEEYRNIRVNGKRLKRGTPIDTGTWSIGEFATVLADILSNTTDAAFTPRGEAEAAGVEALVYGFRVPPERARWRIRFGSQVTPPYQGAVWIDPASARVLRLEMNTRQLPAGYPVDTVESVIDYGWVEIGGSRYLLPVKSENRACFRGKPRCTRNEIEFRNYRKFAVESEVMQVESEIKFPEREEPARGKKPGRRYR